MRRQPARRQRRDSLLDCARKFAVCCVSLPSLFRLVVADDGERGNEMFAVSSSAGRTGIHFRQTPDAFISNQALTSKTSESAICETSMRRSNARCALLVAAPRVPSLSTSFKWFLDTASRGQTEDDSVMTDQQVKPSTH